MQSPASKSAAFTAIDELLATHHTKAAASSHIADESSLVTTAAAGRHIADIPKITKLAFNRAVGAGVGGGLGVIGGALAG